MKNAYKVTLMTIVSVASLAIMSSPASAATLTVDSAVGTTVDDDDCTLPEAAANIAATATTYDECAPVGAYGSDDTIEFNIAGAGPHTIALASTLNLGSSVTLDGSTQTGATCGNLTAGTPHNLLIEIDGSIPGGGGNAAIELSGGSSTVRGLIVTGAYTGGLTVYGISATGGSGHTIECNYVGIGADGATADRNDHGIASLLVDNTIIRNNLISGNDAIGIVAASFAGNSGVTIQGNLIGTDENGDAQAGLGGFIGVGVYGLWSDGAVGGTTNGDGNVVTGFATGIGIYRFGANDPMISVLGNSIYNNNQDFAAAEPYSSVGIDLAVDADGNVLPDGEIGVTPNDAGDGDDGPNGYLNFPVISSGISDGTDTEVDFVLDVPAGDYRVEFFGNDSVHESGYGEGETYLGYVDVTHTGSGEESFSGTLSGVSEATNLTATTTEDLGSGSFGGTSEFSEAVLSTVDTSGGGTDGSGGGDSDDGDLADTGINPAVVTVAGLTLIGSGLGLAIKRNS